MITFAAINKIIAILRFTADLLSVPCKRFAKSIANHASITMIVSGLFPQL